MKGFPGFPSGKLRLTQVPNLFFSDLLPSIDNLAEMKVTLYAFWALAQKEGIAQAPVRDIHRVEWAVSASLLRSIHCSLGSGARIAR